MKYYTKETFTYMIEKKKGVELAALVLMIIISLLPASASATTTVSIQDVSIGEGESTIVPIMINDVVGVKGAHFLLSYDPAVVHVTDIGNSDFNLKTHEDINNSADAGYTRYVVAYTTGTEGLTGDIKFADVTLKAVGNPGDSSPLNITAVALNNGTAEIARDVDNGTFFIEGIDITPPTSISNLQNFTGTTWINWTWTNPSDNDFAYTMVYLNGVFKTNTSSPYYNATGLTANTTYEIGTHTVDVNGNVNDTWVNQTARTIASQDGSVSGTITYTHNETGIAEVTVNLTQNGTSINSTVTDSSGNYTFTNISPGDYNITASKIRFWSNSTSPVTVNAGASTTANLMLWLKGDLNNDGKVSEIDLALMRSAVAEYELPIPVDWKFDINSDGKVNEVDIAIIRNMIA